MTATAGAPRDLALTGVPRGGTTLACRLLGQCRDSIALFEPMPVLELPAAANAALAGVREYFAETRQQLREHGYAPSKQHKGAVPDNLFAEPTGHGERASPVSHGLVRPLQPLSPDFTLVIKHNAAFAALLPELAATLPTLAIVRNPLAVLASWRSVPLPVRDGRLPAGEHLDPGLAARLAAEQDTVKRQLLALDWFFQRFAAHLPGAQVLRYEDIVEGQGEPLFTAAGLQPATPVAALSERNRSLRVDAQTAHRLLDALLDHPGAWRQWYAESDLRALLPASNGP